MDILKELEKLEIKEELAAELKRQKLPLVMYGGGNLAQAINVYLKRYGIQVEDVFVDDEYYSDNDMFEGQKIISYSMLKGKYDLVNVIFGNSNYENIKLLEKRTVINKVFYLFSASYGSYEKVSLDFIKSNIHIFKDIYNLLEDDESRDNLLACLKVRLSGDNSHILKLFKKESSFFNNDIFKINQHEVFLDVGAYDGDTIRSFVKENDGKYQYIYALEPNGLYRKKLEDYAQINNLCNFKITEKGAWKEKQKLYFISHDGQLSYVMEENSGDNCTVIDAERLDTMFEYEKEISLLKINYLVGVKEALMGAEYLLKTYQPKLAVTVGFNCENLRDIPVLIKKINPKYKVYLRYNHGMVETLTCYAVV